MKANIGIVPESESPPSFLTPAEFLEFVARLRGVSDMKAKVEHWLDWFGLDEKRDTMCKDLSKGQRQKVMLASAFIHKPKLLFLDEPFANLDPDIPAQMQAMVAQSCRRGRDHLSLLSRA